MQFDECKLKAVDDKTVIGYRAMYHNKKGMAIMRGNNRSKCQSFIPCDTLLEQLNTGPYINLDDIINDSLEVPH